MAHGIAESDWKVFRPLYRLALERFCERAMEELQSIQSESGKSAHERYLTAYDLLRRRDRELAGLFDGLRRSAARFQLLLFCGHGLLTEQEIAGLSPELQDAVRGFKQFKES